MTLKGYILTLLAGTTVAWACVVLVVTTIDPVEGGWFAVPAFYATLALALLGSFALIGTGVRLLRPTQEPTYRRVIAAFRQSVWYTALVLILLILQHLKLLRWWNVTVLIVALLCLEYIALIKQSYRDEA